MKEIEWDIEAARLITERSTTNFFVVMRPKFIRSVPIKVLEKDLLVLASPCKHQIPDEQQNLQDIIVNHLKQKNTSVGDKCLLRESESQRLIPYAR